MTLTLAQFEERILIFLMDADAAIFSLTTINEGLRQALNEYSRAYPRMIETVITCPGAGHEIALDELEGLIGVSDVWWPYDSTAVEEGAEEWPPARVLGYQLRFGDGSPVLVLTGANQDQPQADDEIRVFYTTLHTIQDLDSAAATTVQADHETLLVRGAAGFALQARAIDLTEVVSANKFAQPNYHKMSAYLLTEFRAALDRLRGVSVTGGAPFAAGFRLDKWS